MGCTLRFIAPVMGSSPYRYMRSNSSPIGKRGLLNTHDGAAPFHQHHVSPTTIHRPHAFADPYHSKPGSLVQGDARLVFREDASLERPNPTAFGSRHQFTQQQQADALSPGPPGYVHADLGHTGIHAPA